MEAKEKSPFGLAQTRMPLLVGAGALILYAVTLNHWARIESLPTLARVTGADTGPVVTAPLHYLVTYPFRWLPAGIQPIALNLLSAVFAALTLALLTRSVSLLPYDRTNDTRWLERNHFSLLSQPPAWLPAVFAALLCGLQLTFWEHATAMTGEMLDLLLFAYVARCVLEYRVGHREDWLYKMAFVYGLAITNNYAMIAFFPCFLIALIWIMEADFFRVQFLGRMIGAGAAGLLLYLVLPLVNMLAGDETTGFIAYLRAVVGTQKGMLLAFKPYVILLLSFTSLLPLTIIGIRWTGGLGDHSAAGAAMATIILRVVYAALLAACVSIFFEPKWSPRTLGFGFALLPFYYIAAMSAGYFVGYFLLVFSVKTAWPAPRQAAAPPPKIKPAGVVLIAAAAFCAVMLAKRNLLPIRFSNGSELGQLADFYVKTLPARPVYVIADKVGELVLAQLRLRKSGASADHVFVSSGLLQYRTYNVQLANRYGQRWPFRFEGAAGRGVLQPEFLTAMLVGLTRSNEVYYLNHSFGYFFESLQARPRGMTYSLQVLPDDPILPPRLTAQELDENQKFWQEVEPVLRRLPRPPENVPADWQWLRQIYSRALNTWATTLQQHDRVADATKWYELAVVVNPENLPAKVNLAFNTRLAAKDALKDLDPARAAEQLPRAYGGTEGYISIGGPFDDPAWLYRTAEEYMQANLFRQSLVAFDRLHKLFPANPAVDLWRRNMEIMTRFGLGDTANAEKQALALCLEHPREDSVLEALTQIYMMTARFSNALDSVDKQLALNPSNQRALLNKAAVCIHLQQFTNAIPPLDKLLSLVPDSAAALMNRAIAHLQCGNLDQAERDYEALRKTMPAYHPVYYGLGEIAYRRNDKASALSNYELYLKYGQRDSEEYQRIAERVKELQSGKGT